MVRRGRQSEAGEDEAWWAGGGRWVEGGRGRREIVVRKRGREERQGGGRDGVEGGEGGNVMARLATGGAPT